jgi:hypothetical protein
MSKPKIDWDQIPVAIDDNAEPNPRNPHALSSAKDREKAMRDHARTILLRKAMRIASN